MVPQAFTNLIDTCNRAILSLESCIAAADTCEDLCTKVTSCPPGAGSFIEHAKACITTCQETIKVCEEMHVQFKDENHDEHKAALDYAIKTLGECIWSLRTSIESCSVLDGCRTACQDARNACEKALIAVDQCIESCEKHEVFYKEVQPFKKY